MTSVKNEKYCEITKKPYLHACITPGPAQDLLDIYRSHLQGYIDQIRVESENST